MDRVYPFRFGFLIRTYCQLTKPGIVLGNAITAFGGFALASKGNIDLGLLLSTLTGLCLIMAAGCVANNYLDRHSDQKMERTKGRALATNRISSRAAKLFSAILCAVGIAILALCAPPLTLLVTLFGLAVYVALYTPLKYRSVHATLIGSLAGAVPPVVGYCAVTHRLDTGALLLFALLVFWQMPHFYAIALYRLKDYAAAAIPVLPLERGSHTTKMQMLFYVGAFICTATLITPLCRVGLLWLTAETLLGLAWILLTIRGFKIHDEKDEVRWAKQMFKMSLVVITALCGLMSL